MSAAEDFEEFVAIVDGGSLTAAARALGLPRTTVSRRLARLEERLGARLLFRTTRRVQMTPQGEALYADARRVVMLAREVERSVARLDGVPRGLLRVSVPAGVPETVFSEWMADFLLRYPEVQLDVVATATHVDLVAEGFDVAMRAGPIEDASLHARVLAHNVLVGVAAPSYLRRRSPPPSPAALGEHNCILGYRAGSVPEARWPLHDGSWVKVAGNFKSNQMSLRLGAAKRGVGLALVAERLAMDAIEAGELEVVLPGQLGREEKVSLVYPDRRFLDPKVRAFVDFMVDQVRAAHASPET